MISPSRDSRLPLISPPRSMLRRSIVVPPGGPSSTLSTDFFFLPEKRLANTLLVLGFLDMEEGCESPSPCEAAERRLFRRCDVSPASTSGRDTILGRSSIVILVLCRVSSKVGRVGEGKRIERGAVTEVILRQVVSGPQRGGQEHTPREDQLSASDRSKRLVNECARQGTASIKPQQMNSLKKRSFFATAYHKQPQTRSPNFSFRLPRFVTLGANHLRPSGPLRDAIADAIRMPSSNACFVRQAGSNARHR